MGYDNPQVLGSKATNSKKKQQQKERFYSHRSMHQWTLWQDVLGFRTKNDQNRPTAAKLAEKGSKLWWKMKTTVAPYAALSRHACHHFGITILFYNIILWEYVRIIPIFSKWSANTATAKPAWTLICWKTHWHAPTTFRQSNMVVLVANLLKIDQTLFDMAVGQNLVPLVNIKIAGKWMFIPLKIILIGTDPYPYLGWPSAALFISSDRKRT